MSRRGHDPAFPAATLLPQVRANRYDIDATTPARTDAVGAEVVAVEAALILPALLMIAAVATGSWREFLK